MRILHLLVIAALVLSAAYVYKIKFESTLQVESVAKLRHQIRQERDAVAALRAEWAKLDNPARLKGLAERHLPLRQMQSRQIDDLDRLPERPLPTLPPPGADDPIGAMIDLEAGLATGSIGKGAR